MINKILLKKTRKLVRELFDDHIRDLNIKGQPEAIEKVGNLLFVTLLADFKDEDECVVTIMMEAFAVVYEEKVGKEFFIKGVIL
ncbi:hypothetical protein [Cronobacter turicensis]|uniref:hypothetical protein n=1 Tax=Cronobacter turicensis TaxID=413502 RepID=UPI0024C37936|nr:hypothetical protein [Cronobacter turicensis]MDK1238036.1 hypothetical protein [Cronobacter turicensis]